MDQFTREQFVKELREAAGRAAMYEAMWRQAEGDVEALKDHMLECCPDEGCATCGKLVCVELSAEHFSPTGCPSCHATYAETHPHHGGDDNDDEAA